MKELSNTTRTVLAVIVLLAVIIGVVEWSRANQREAAVDELSQINLDETDSSNVTTDPVFQSALNKFEDSQSVFSFMTVEAGDKEERRKRRMCRFFRRAARRALKANNFFEAAYWAEAGADATCQGIR